MTIAAPPIDFSLAPAQSATAPPERRGIARDNVRLMVADRSSSTIEHTRFRDLANYLRAGDALIVNVSRTIPASVPAHTESGHELRVHFASPAANGMWSVEVRTPNGIGTSPGPDLKPQTLRLPAGASAHLVARNARSPRLWHATIDDAGEVGEYLELHGDPIRYAEGPRLPLTDYQTVFATESGSAEMPSAGRPFTPELVTTLVSHGVVVLPVILHTGVSSFEDDELPGDERFRVPESTAIVANALRSAGGRVIAVGTTVVRALETAAGTSGELYASEGVTDVVVTPERGVSAVDGLLSGWHEPRSSHLKLLEAVAGRPLLERCYAEAVAKGYLWHEFGDEILILDAPRIARVRQTVRDQTSGSAAR